MYSPDALAGGGELFDDAAEARLGRGRDFEHGHGLGGHGVGGHAGVEREHLHVAAVGREGGAAFGRDAALFAVDERVLGVGSEAGYGQFLPGCDVTVDGAAAQLFVGADDQAHAALQPHAGLAQGFHGEHGTDGRAFVVGDAAAVEQAVLDHAPPGVAAPAFAGGNDVDVSEHGDHLGQRFVAQLGDADLILESPSAEAVARADLDELVEGGFRPGAEGRVGARRFAAHAGHGDELADRVDQAVPVFVDNGADLFHVHVGYSSSNKVLFF